MTMTTFDVCKNVRLSVLRRAGEVMAYSKSWGADFCVKQMAGARAELEKRADWFRPVDANDLTESELEELGFGKWSDELPIRLIPIWLKPFLQDKIEAQSISGEKFTSTDAMDNDHRFGCLAYGVLPKAEVVNPGASCAVTE